MVLSKKKKNSKEKSWKDNALAPLLSLVEADELKLSFSSNFRLKPYLFNLFRYISPAKVNGN